MPSHGLLAAVDLGSNSFRLSIARVEEGPAGAQVFPIDSCKESVRLAAGLQADQTLDQDSQQRALKALSRFSERLKSFAPEQVRAVATNTLRVARNAGEFLALAEATLGFPIEIIAGREEARLIYYGVAHTLPKTGRPRLVIDIGGGSTEFIIGTDYTPKLFESVYVGCVTWTQRFFPQGRITQDGMRGAILAARAQIALIAPSYRALGWHEAIGSSGSAKAILQVLAFGADGAQGADDTNSLEHGITLAGLKKLQTQLVKAGHVRDIQLKGIKADRREVIPGGLAILSAAFEELGIQTLHYGEGALRLGVLYDLLGRQHADDMRTTTVAQFAHRYQVNSAHAERVGRLASALYASASTLTGEELAQDQQRLQWAAMLHEIGWSIAHSSYHKHSAYILHNADMPGFSRIEQTRLANLVLGHAGKLNKLETILRQRAEWLAVLCLRLAVVVLRRRVDLQLPGISLKIKGSGWVLAIDASWLSAHPLTEFSLREEMSQWRRLGFELDWGV